MPTLPVNPFDSQRYVGPVIRIDATSVHANLPFGAKGPDSVHGATSDPGGVGGLAVIETEHWAVLARLEEVRLPESERLGIDPAVGAQRASTNPVGQFSLLAAVSLIDGSITAGIPSYPRLSDRVYTAPPTFVQWLVEQEPGVVVSAVPSVRLEIASLFGSELPVRVTPERLFGRHCAIVGTTGGGKSWTLARLVEESARHNSKVILLDPTGEFRTLSSVNRHVHFGVNNGGIPMSQAVAMPYRELLESDLFAVFRPSGQAQAPKLRAAMKSLKLARLEPLLANNGVIEKAGRIRQPFDHACVNHATALEQPEADFDLTKLGQQIEEECIFPTGRPPQNFGGYADNDRGFCINLVMRVEQLIAAPEMAPIFRPGAALSIGAVIDDFLASADHVLRVSLQDISAQSDARKIITNAIGRLLLSRARAGRFAARPLVTFIDEAHHFLSDSLGDEANRWPLDSFELIAKEGRKYGLTVCFATQRPRDLPDDVMSQVGTLIAHRLINASDRRVVEHAASDIDVRALKFLPSLSSGQALLVGVGFAFPLIIQVQQPTTPPASDGPKFQTTWI